MDICIFRADIPVLGRNVSGVIEPDGGGDVADEGGSVDVSVCQSGGNGYLFSAVVPDEVPLY